MPILDYLLKMDLLVVMDLLTRSWIIFLEAAFFKKGVLTTFWRKIIFFVFSPILTKFCQIVAFMSTTI